MATAGFLIATRLSGEEAGVEPLALTAAVVGGNSLGGGRGSVINWIMWAIIVLVTTNGLIRLGYGTGTNQMVLGLLLAAAMMIDIRWLKNRHWVLNEVYVAPVYLKLGEAPGTAPGVDLARGSLTAIRPVLLDYIAGSADLLTRSADLFARLLDGAIRLEVSRQRAARGRRGPCRDGGVAHDRIDGSRSLSAPREARNPVGGRGGAPCWRGCERGLETLRRAGHSSWHVRTYVRLDATAARLAAKRQSRTTREWNIDPYQIDIFSIVLLSASGGVFPCEAEECAFAVYMPSWS